MFMKFFFFLSLPCLQSRGGGALHDRIFFFFLLDLLSFSSPADHLTLRIFSFFFFFLVQVAVGETAVFHLPLFFFSHTVGLFFVTVGLSFFPLFFFPFLLHGGSLALRIEGICSTILFSFLPPFLPRAPIS